MPTKQTQCNMQLLRGRVNKATNTCIKKVSVGINVSVEPYAKSVVSVAVGTTDDCIVMKEVVTAPIGATTECMAGNDNAEATENNSVGEAIFNLSSTSLASSNVRQLLAKKIRAKPCEKRSVLREILTKTDTKREQSTVTIPKKNCSIAAMATDMLHYQERDVIVRLLKSKQKSTMADLSTCNSRMNIFTADDSHVSPEERIETEMEDENQKTDIKYNCEKCNKPFFNLILLELHTREMHSSSRKVQMKAMDTKMEEDQNMHVQYNCHKCNELFCSAISLEVHTQEKHSSNLSDIKDELPDENMIQVYQDSQLVYQISEKFDGQTSEGFNQGETITASKHNSLPGSFSDFVMDSKVGILPRSSTHIEEGSKNGIFPGSSTNTVTYSKDGILPESSSTDCQTGSIFPVDASDTKNGHFSTKSDMNISDGLPESSSTLAADSKVGIKPECSTYQIDHVLPGTSTAPVVDSKDDSLPVNSINLITDSKVGILHRSSSKCFIERGVFSKSSVPSWSYNMQTVSDSLHVLPSGTLDIQHSSNKIDNQKTIKCTGKKTYICDVCRKSLASSALLRNHMRIHSGEKPYKCDVCGKAFTFSNKLHIHKKIHTGNFKCDICCMTFKLKTNLNRHLKSHAEEKPFKFDVKHS